VKRGGVSLPLVAPRVPPAWESSGQRARGRECAAPIPTGRDMRSARGEGPGKARGGPEGGLLPTAGGELGARAAGGGGEEEE